MATKKPTTTKLSPSEAEALAADRGAGERIAEMALAELATERSDKRIDAGLEASSFLNSD